MRLPLLALIPSVLFIFGGCTSKHPTTQQPNDPTTKYRDASPRWSPDSKRIAFLRIFGDRLTQLWVADSELRNPRAVSPVDSVRWARPPITGRAAPVAPDAPSWSPDGRRIVVSRGERIPFEGKRNIGGTGLWAYEVDTGAAVPIAVHPAGYADDLQFYRAPAWSPDGKRIAYMAEGVFGYASLVIHTLGATRPDEQSPPVDLLDDYGWPTWSPDGRWLAFRHSLYQSESALPVESIQVIAPGTHRSRTMHVKSSVHNELWRASHLAWSPDSTRMGVRIYASGGANSGRVAVADIQSGRMAFSKLQPKRALMTVSWPQQSHHGQPAPDEPMRIVTDANGLRFERPDGIGMAVFPTDDFDISADGRLIVVSDPDKQKPSAPTALRVYQL